MKDPAKLLERSDPAARHAYVSVKAGVVSLVVWMALAAIAPPALPAAPPASSAAGPQLGDVLANIERHYNSLATLRVYFSQTVSYAGRPPRVERGTLSLLRPQKMRWEYEQPPGKLLVGDGNVLHMYNRQTNQVRPVRLDQTGDLRAPLSFLLGRLRFRRQFRNLYFEEIDGRTTLVGEGRPGKDYYSRVEFRYDPDDFHLERLNVIGRDDTVTTFTFKGEIVNASMDPALFEFQPPAGAEILEMPPLAGGGQ